MSFKLPYTFFLFLFLFLKVASSNEDGFTFNGFSSINLLVYGSASIAPNGLLQLTDAAEQTSHAFYPYPINMYGAKIHSFSSSFVFAIVSENPDFSDHGIAFVISPTADLYAVLPYQYLGLYNQLDNDHRYLAIELDTVLNTEFGDIDNNHVGIDISDLRSISTRTAGYYAGSDDNRLFQNLSLASGKAMQVWIDFNGDNMQLNVTLSPIQMPKPNLPLLSTILNLSGVMNDSMYVGFSSTTGSSLTYHSILGWSFKINGKTESLDYATLPPLPHFEEQGTSSVSIISPALYTVAFIVLLVRFIVKKRNKYAELLEDWEKEYGPHRFSYKDLYRATNGFKDKELLGTGGFGIVYHGVLPVSNIEVAVKRVSRDSRQGMKEFVAEIVSIGQLRHRNIVQLLGYCRRKGELLLVYEFMPNRSLDKFLHDPTKPTLDWAQRFRIIKGVASGLLYLHADWEQVVIHRDIKASNVLLDGDMNGRLGDFGLARLYDHGTDPNTTHVAGTMGYLAPEVVRIGMASTKTDVFAFGAFLFEVACGRRPVDHQAAAEETVLMDWVLQNWKKGSLLRTMDPRLVEETSVSEMEKVLKLGLLCCHPIPESRPSMRQVMQVLDEDAMPPELSPAYMDFNILSTIQNEACLDYNAVLPLSAATVTLSSFAEGR